MRNISYRRKEHPKCGREWVDVENYYFATTAAKTIRARIIEFKKKSTMKSKIFGGAEESLTDYLLLQEKNTVMLLIR